MASESYTPKPHFLYARIPPFGLLLATSSAGSQPVGIARARPTLTAPDASSQGIRGPCGHDAAPTGIFRAVMAGSDNDEPGVLGNLPRSRPGRRSDKRGVGGTRAAKTAGAAKSSGSRASGSSGARAKRPTAAASSAKSGTRPSTARKAPRSTGAPASAASSRSEPRARPEPAREPGDPLTQAVRLAGKVAETGVKTGVGILRRLSGR